MTKHHRRGSATFLHESRSGKTWITGCWLCRTPVLPRVPRREPVVHETFAAAAEWVLRHVSTEAHKDELATRLLVDKLADAIEHGDP